MNLLTARPARSDRHVTACINCHERLIREGQNAQGRFEFHHQSNGLQRCPDYAQPRGMVVTRTATVTKYTRRGGQLEVSVHQRADNGQWQVTDFRGAQIKTQLLATRSDAENAVH